MLRNGEILPDAEVPAHTSLDGEWNPGTAIGIAQGSQQPTVLLIGDVAFCHDQSSLTALAALSDRMKTDEAHWMTIASEMAVSDGWPGVPSAADICLKGGFRNNLNYHLIYRAAGSPVMGSLPRMAHSKL